MGLLNYSTQIPVHKTLSEIQYILVSHGAKKIMYDYGEGGTINELCFSVITPYGEKGVRLPAKVDATLKVLHQQKKERKIKGTVDREQAARVAWRIIKDWVELQMALLETEQAEFCELFFPYLLDNTGKNTLYEVYKQKQLPAGGEIND